ncbi:hypothetical protein DSM3645_03698 [Blastopirellula marina DSM 3645]|uniref:Uncharacterized protein n=1 Tax=Blastopirellula marina DSM 3645 TaxID=314230 RepID=A3ZW51_9BACT|nr:hypothetical protein DSM3645_03698 [Blastopirellula marina DSM 3645]
MRGFWWWIANRARSSIAISAICPKFCSLRIIWC